MEAHYSYKWFFLAILSLGLGGGFAFLVAMSRTPFGYKYFPPDYMYHALAGHVVLAILLWLLSFTVVLWSRYLKSDRGGKGTLPIFLRYVTCVEKYGKCPFSWLLKYSYLISLSGIILVTLSVLTSNGMAVPNNYVPTIVDPLFFAGLSLFSLGFFINVFGYLKGALRHLRSQDILSSTLSVSVLIAAVMVFSMFYSLIIHREAAEPFVYYERLFWTPGHIQQILNGALLASVWYALLRVLGMESKSWKFLRYANLALLLSAIFLFSLQIFIDPVDKLSRVAAELTYTIGLGVPLFLHIANILKKMFTPSPHAEPSDCHSELVSESFKGFEIPKQPVKPLNQVWGQGKVRDDIQEQFQGDTTANGGNKRVAKIALVLSMAIYITGVAIAYSGFGNDLRVPAHYHGAVTSLTLALMGFSYYLIREMTYKVYGERIARVQPVIYGVGMLLFILGLFISGAFGAPRKTYGVAFTSDPVVLSALTVMGIGTILAVTGGILFVTYITISLLKNQRMGWIR